MSLYDDNGIPNVEITNYVEDAMGKLVKGLIEKISPAPLDPIGQRLLVYYLQSSATMTFLFQSVEYMVGGGAGLVEAAESAHTKNPIDILSDDVDHLYEKVENGFYTENSSHDMVQMFDRMVSSAKKGKTYFDFDDDFDDE